MGGPETRAPAASERTSLWTLAALFGRMGATTFGGPAAHIALLRTEAVERRRWLTDATFLDLLGATNLIPGPNSTEMVMHVGWVRRGLPGLVVAGLAFIGPAALITGLLAWAYVEHGSRPEAGWLLYGVKPVMLAVVLHALRAMAPKAAPTGRLRVLGLAAAGAVLLGVDEIATLIACGLAAVVAARVTAPAGALPLLGLATAGPAIAAAAPTALGLFGLFVKIGAVLYGSGYVLLSFLRADFVERTGWLSEAQLLDAIAIGQVTPGPVFTTATFIGYLLAGAAGATWATVGIFLPAFVFVALSGPLIPRLRRSAVASACLDGVNVASLALMAVVTAQLGRAALVDAPTIALSLAALAGLLFTAINPTWFIAGGALVGLGLHLAGLST
jgi:chromate transporter